MQCFRIEWLCQLILVFANRLRGHLGQKVGRACEQVVPPAFGFELSKNPSADGFLFILRQLGCLGHRSLKQLSHDPVILPSKSQLRGNHPLRARQKKRRPAFAGPACNPNRGC